MHDPNGTDTAREVANLAAQTQGVPTDAPCCAWCAGITMDCAVPPEPPARVLKRRRGCAVSIVAYTAAREHMKGRDVKIAPTPGGAPSLTVNGEPVNPLKHYGNETCGCEPETDAGEF